MVDLYLLVSDKQARFKLIICHVPGSVDNLKKYFFFKHLIESLDSGLCLSFYVR